MTKSRNEIPSNFALVKPLSGFGQTVGPFYLKDGISVDEEGVTHLGLKMAAAWRWPW